MKTPFTGLALVLAVCLTPALGSEKSGWVQFRGPSAAGPAFAGELPDKAFGLEVAWTRALGSGYSNVWIEGGRAVTMFTDGDVDVVASFALETGEEQWRYELGQKYAGHDGSDDGPVGTPTVSAGVVYTLGPRGQLVALDLAKGSERWRRDLDEKNSNVPFYGYSTSPLVAGKQLIVATGGEGHAVTAFNRDTGETLWASGDDSVSYQTPMLVELGGKQQLLTVTDLFLQGLDPASGKMLWQLKHAEGDQPDAAAHPTVLDGQRFLVKYANGARLYTYADGAVKETWQTRAFGNTYALPVLIGSHLYGFTGAALTCASAESGEIVWRAREAGSFGLSAVDGVLAIATRDGELLLVDPSPEGYREIARIPVLERGDYAVPTFANGLFVVRNLEQLAAVRVDTSVSPAVAQADESDRLLGAFGKWIASVEALSEAERQSAVDQRFAAVDTTPLIEDDGHVHVVWRGDATDVGLTGDLVAEGQELGLYELGGTGLYFRSLQLDPKGQYTYNLIVDFGDATTDPGNPYSVDNGFGVASDLRMPGWPASPHLETPDDGTPRGTLDRFQFRSEILENTREIQLWRPADYGQDPERRHPVLVVNHGDNLLRGGLMQNTLDNLVGHSVAPLIAIFVPRVSGPEYGGAQSEEYTRFLIEELLPHVDRHYRTDPTRRAIMGPGSAGVAAILAAVEHPDVFSRAAAQSFYPIAPAQDRLPEIIAGSAKKPELVYLVYSNRDYDFGEGRQAAVASRELIGQLRAANVKVVEQVSDYSPGWAGWRGQDDEILAAMFPAATAEK